MSVEYTVQFGVFHKTGYNEMLDRFLAGRPHILCKTSEDGISRFFFTEGSVRGFSANRAGAKKINIRLNHYASTADADMVCDFFNFLTREYKAAIFHESGQKLKKADLSNESMRGTLLAGNPAALFDAVLANEEYLSLPVWDVHITLYRDDYTAMKQDPAFPANLDAYLQAKAKCYFFAGRAALIKLDSGVTISVWAYDSTVMYPSQYVSLQNPNDSEDTLFIRWVDFMALPFVKYEAIPLGKNRGEYYFIHRIGKAAAEQAYQLCEPLYDEDVKACLKMH